MTTIEADESNLQLNTNLASFRNETLKILLRICNVLAGAWFALVLLRINQREMIQIGLPWFIFAAFTTIASIFQHINNYRVARLSFFIALIATPIVTILLASKITSFAVYALLMPTVIAGLLYTPQSPFILAGLSIAFFGVIGVLRVLNLLPVASFNSVAQYGEIFGGASLLLLMVATISWLATRDLVSTVAWAMDNNRLAERRAERLQVSESRVARTLLELEGAYDTQSHLNEELRNLNTQLQQARAAADEANTLKTRFLANMSHELRTPLNAIINFTQFMAKPRYGELSSRQLELQERVLVNSEHLLGLINDILDLSKIEAGRMELHLESVDLQPIFHGVMSTAVGLTKSKGLNLETDVEEDLPPVRGDKVRVRQILLNLLSNAAKFTDKGGITLRAFERDGMIQTSIIDTGSGIPPEELPLVFEEFHQVEQAASYKRQQGTGLGLPISRDLVELQGGKMWAESTVDVGSSFSFTLPIAHTMQPETIIFEPTKVKESV